MGRLEIGDFSTCFSRFLSFGLPCGARNVAQGASGRQLWGPGWPPWETFPRFVRVCFFSAFRGRFLQHFSNIFHRFPPVSGVCRALRARSAAGAEAAEGGEASPPGSTWVGFNVFAPCPARPATSDEVRRMKLMGYHLCRRLQNFEKSRKLSNFIC